MKKRYLIVLVLYSLTHLVSAIAVSSKCISNRYLSFVLRTLLGYGIFATGLHYFAKLKRKAK
ncbi:hypothetical protein ACIGHE_10905 [Staphylococcus pasteuri]|uniref:hypothetical protein n=1 Tax=Staphylococcus pasteuri TaxID=45972 RepID=UPI0037D54076